MSESERVRKVNAFVEDQLDRLMSDLEEMLDSDVMAIMGPIYPGLENAVKNALVGRNEKKDNLAFVLDTPGGIIEVVERIVNTIRHFYKVVIAIVPDTAMSAGTVLTLSADRIMMDWFSCLGPIDPQVERENSLVPALSYLVQYERLKQKSLNGELTTAELVLLQKLDLAELHKFEEAKELSVSLLKEWLVKYKFKDWTTTETRRRRVTPKMKETRAIEIAEALIDHQKWHSHGRPITMEVLRKFLNLKIEDFSENKKLQNAIIAYHQFLDDYIQKIGINTMVHTKGHCIKLR